MTEEEFMALTGQAVNKKKTPKYRNKKVYVYANGYIGTDKEMHACFGKPVAVYDSIKEYDRWNELLLLEKAGEISNLSRQSDWLISDGCVYDGKKVQKIVYKADFQYARGGKQVVEDVKPLDNKTGKYRTTKDFKLKWKLLKSKYPNVVFEIY